MDFIIYLTLFLFGLFFRTGYELLKEKRKVRGDNKILFAALLVVMTLMWMSWFAMCPLDPVRLNVTGTVGSLGLAVEAAGLILALAALVQLRGLENIKQLVTSGLFARIRHPMYLGFVLWIIGCTLQHGAVVSFAAGLVGIANIIYWGKLENARLEAAYGDEYLRYRRRTWF